MQRKPCFGFSVLEAAAALAIVAGVTATLFPVIAQARDSTAGTRICAVHALQRAAALYSQDYGRTFSREMAFATGDCVQTSSTWTNSGGGCTDAATGLTWSLSLTDVAGVHYPQDMAASWCRSMGQNGYAWRLPTLDEMKTAASHDATQYIDADDWGAYRWSGTTKGNRAYAHDLISQTFLTLKTSNFEATCVHN